MKINIELTPEDFKAKKGLTLDELINGGGKKTAKKPVKKDEDADDEDEDTDEDADEDADDEDTDEDADEDSDADIDADMIKEHISLAVKAGNKPKVEALFKKYKAKTVSGLKEAQYTKFYAELKPLTKKKK
jgi:hypothetical protein